MIIEHSFEGLSHTWAKPTGPKDSKVLLVGDAPAEKEDESGYVFSGRTGQELDRFYLPLVGLRRPEVRVTNLIPVWPYSNRDPVKAEIDFFEHILLDEIAAVKPEYIVPMGAVAVKYFLGPPADLHQVHGIPHKSKRFNCSILPSYHPAAGLHNSDNQPLIVYDFQQMALAIQGLLPPKPEDTFPKPIYMELTTADEVRYSLEGCQVEFMGMDTEGYPGSPWGLSYSTDDGVSYVIRSAAKVALAEVDRWLDVHREVTVILHNALHDLPILREMGVRVPKFEDTMVYAYCLCLEPQGLKDLAYRHCGMRMKSYEDVVGPAVRKLTAEYLLKVAAGDWGLDPKVPLRDSDQTIKYRQPQALHKRALSAVNDIFGLYTGTIIGPRRGGSALLKDIGVRVGKVDAEAAIGLPKDLNAWLAEVPIPIKPRLEELYGEYIFELKEPVPPEEPADAVKRWESMQEDLEESVERCEASIGSLPITGLDALPDQSVAVDYSATDARATLNIRHKLRQKVEASGLLRLAELDMSVLPFVDRMKTAGIKVNREHMLDYGAQLKIEMRELQEKLQRDLGVWINPSSSVQVADVVYNMLGFPVEVRTEKGQPSTNDKVLEGLASLNPSIKDITDYRELHKLRSTYAIKLPNWTDKYGRCHPNWKVTRVASGRLATNDPNLLAIPARTEKGKNIRRGFIPEPGRVFVGVDMSQIEMRVLAHYSQDPKLLKIFQDGQVDFHAQTAAFMWNKTLEEIADDDALNGSASMRSSGKNCVHPATIIAVPDGIQCIGVLDFPDTEHTFRAVSGVQLHDGDSYKNVSHTYNAGIKKMVHVVSNRGFLTCTEDHLFELADGSLRKAADLHADDALPEPSLPLITVSRAYVPVPVKINRYVPVTYILPTNDLAYFAGVFTGDGCSTTAKTGNISLAHGPVDAYDDYGNLYAEWRDSLLDTCLRVGMSPVHLSDRYIDLGRRNFHGYMTGLGVISTHGKTLRIPDWVMAAGREALMHFIAGLIDTDGTVGAKSPAIEICTKDVVFAGQIAAALTALGMSIGVDAAYNKTYCRYYYEIRINSTDTLAWKPYLRHKGKISRLRPAKVNLKRIPHYIKRVLDAGNLPCVDVSVESESHLHLTNIFRTHNCSFGIVYGIGARGLVAQLKSKTGKDWSEEAGQEMIDRWLQDAYAYVNYYMERQKHKARTDGYVESMFGRRRYLPGVHSSIPRIREEAYRQAINHPIQSTAAEILKVAEKYIWDNVLPTYWESGIFAECILAVHDELIFEVDECVAEELQNCVIDAMQFAVELAVPVLAKGHITKTAELGGNWADLK